MRDSRWSQKDLLWTCALQQKRDSNTGQLENSGNHLQTIYMYATSCQRVGLVFDLAITCFTYCRKNFKKVCIFLLLQKLRLLQSTLLTRISSSRLRCCLVGEEAGCCFLIGVVVPQNLAKGIVVLLFSSITQSKFVRGVQGSLEVLSSHMAVLVHSLLGQPGYWSHM